ncbi:MAG: leader peptidase (prepilin peptidase)/N-methyltransferase [Colwellia sp.]|jgi:leader peptidase (prepilin peptidase)/N-methyltransferase
MIEDMLEVFKYYPYIFYIVIAVHSLMIGSFLNVVIYRFPKMLEQDWSRDCRLYLASENEVEQTITMEVKLTLSKPDSTCPSCQYKIRFYENIPIISWLFLGRKCSQCHLPISIRYPMVEGLTAILSVVVSWHYGVTWNTLFVLVLTWSVICLFFIDYDHMFLPDEIVVPLIWLGLLVNVNGGIVSLDSAVIGAVAGYGVLYCLMCLYKAITGREGMGNGDFKLVAMFGAWFGWALLPILVFLSSLALTITGMTLMLFKGWQREKEIPFGPYLIPSGLVTLMWGENIWLWYLG